MKIILITGGTSGMGKAMTEKFLQQNNIVIVFGRKTACLEVLKNKFKDKLYIYKVDISQKDQLIKVFEDIKQKFSSIDVLINAAGFNIITTTSIPFENAIDNWDKVMETNLKGAFMVTILAIPLISNMNGRIINISSIGAFTGGNSAGGLAYAASKAGLNGLTMALARELSLKGITVNSIAPGFIEQTGFTEAFTEEKITSIIKEVPVNRAGNVNDIAELCLFISSENSGYITGEIIQINGGWLFGR
ncbi:SDR family NAD(P)-dependent oxidoreductase [Elizabethkingia anophelis]|uniref:SDR family NAD(P)-dependent oxidoreductase n=1 Tax=Elizabethkingia anophelis TaxID=1117645 RepID=UPI0020B3DB61|nr:SDR family NAD(P)-dependent oxidoreductase [Elizabethkingia anophelis]MCT4306149.1 SDR family oxidoreductase [Elizabethkingia anophelis]UTF95116.1 SDR family oxidoreductase [Elizabethkingia anophelis]